ncbi:transposase [Streptomyces sp. NPDC007896]|uniref:transposase n=1 Tax=Streptomyces sp. NPDC007896 TaxID=3364784 RepID=UPI0036ECB265
MARCPEPEATHQHIRDFGEILTCRLSTLLLSTLLPDWIDAVIGDDLPGLTGFAHSMHNDFDAVTAGLTLEWSSGGTEGAVNRIKKIKRQLYGRAALSARGLAAPASNSSGKASCCRDGQR